VTSVKLAYDEQEQAVGRMNRAALRRSILSAYGKEALFNGMGVTTKKSIDISPQALIKGRHSLGRNVRGRATSMSATKYLGLKSEDLKHYRFPPLSESARVGFSLRNMVSANISMC
jgi:hypothetical protein